MMRLPTLVRRSPLFAAVACVTAACSDGTTAPVDSTPVPVAISITTPGLVQDGDVVTLTAAARTASGSVVPGIALQWSLSDPAVATISDVGVLTALRDGTVQVIASASVNGRTLEQRLTVPITQRPAVSLDVNQPVIDVPLSTDARVGATLRSEDGRVLQHRTLTWSSDDPTVARVEADGRIVPVRPGATMIRVRFETLASAVQVRVPFSTATYDLASVNALSLPATVEEFTADDTTGPQRYQVRVEGGTVTFGASYRITLQVSTYRVSELQGNTIAQLVSRSTLTDYGVVEYNGLSGAMALRSEYVGGLMHDVTVPASGPEIRFRLPGTNTIWTLATRLRS